MKAIGPTFVDELRAAGVALDGLSWSGDGTLNFNDDVSGATKQMVQAVLAAHDPQTPGRRLVRKSLIVQRLNDAGKLAAARAALDADLYARERWYAPDQPGVYADDAEVLAMLGAIGADPDTVLAEEG